jgi:hypothetical protein
VERLSMLGGSSAFQHAFQQRLMAFERGRRRDEEPAVCGGISRWAHLGSNQGPPACEAGALPLSYAPGRGSEDSPERFAAEGARAGR